MARNLDIIIKAADSYGGTPLLAPLLLNHLLFNDLLVILIHISEDLS